MAKRIKRLEALLDPFREKAREYEDPKEFVQACKGMKADEELRSYFESHYGPLFKEDPARELKTVKRFIDETLENDLM